MTTEGVLLVLRRLIDEVDESLSDYTDPELLAALSDARDALEVQGITGFAALAVGTDVTDDETYGIVPEPSVQQAVILAYRAAVALLRQVYNAKVRRGELGGSWTSGLEGESTINTQRAYKEAVDDLERQADGFVAILMALRTGTRPQ